jgi:ribose 5-phosphate isomerase B
MKQRSILFICTGNTCRSVIAEYLFKKLIQESHLEEFTCSSSGVHVIPGVGVSKYTRELLEREGIDASKYEAQMFDLKKVKEAYLVLAMTLQHKKFLEKLAPLEGKIFTLREYVGDEEFDIYDPLGSSIEGYETCFREIKTALKKLVTILARSAIGKVIALGSDHAGYTIKEYLKEHLVKENLEYYDFGTFSVEPVDYPEIALKVAQAIEKGEFKRGVLICGTGIGMSIVANKFRGIRGSVCHDHYTARVSRSHNDSNLLILGSRVISSKLAWELFRIWLETPFSGGRHERRIQKLLQIEQRLG